MTDVAVVVKGITKHYPRHRALDGISLTLPAGVCLALLGHNGAGKTTFMKLMLGLIKPTGGTLQVLGQAPAGAPLSFRHQLGYLPENVSFYDEMTGRDTLTFFARLKQQPLSQCDDLLDQVGLTHAADRRVKTYSKGMRQRLGLAQALLGKPRLLLLDEPTTGLDPILRQEFFRIIRDLSSDGTTVILSSHILTELEARTDLVAILGQGHLQAFGTLSQLRQQANLPMRIRLTLSEEGMDFHLPHTRLGPTWVELTCPVEEKMELLAQITALGKRVSDVELLPPTLDDLYVHFGHRRQELEP
ncbi:MAG: ABC transporter ATP-binding protein [Magnetococcales bacterium]|nr:ABC transporter ATP-binding protein [Magnetococcales bacterium]NGZ25631.1 ABC transporter ATP-binding protein [Magnetococcales bacterium]